MKAYVIKRDDGKYLKLTNGKIYFTKYIQYALITPYKKDINYWLVETIFLDNCNCKVVPVEIREIPNK